MWEKQCTVNHAKFATWNCGELKVPAGFIHHTQNEIPYLFPTFSWLYDPYSLPILHEIVWNLFIYREYFKILDTRGNSFLTIWFCLWSNIIFIVLMNWVFQRLWKHEISYLFLTFWPISQPFPTLSANSLPFQGLKQNEIWFLTFSRFSLPVGTLCKTFLLHVIFMFWESTHSGNHVHLAF